MSFFTHLECSVPCGAPVRNPRGTAFLCSCGAPLLARYDLDKARALVARNPQRPRGDDVAIREMLPIYDGESPVTLGEGFTPLFHARRLGASIGLGPAVHQGRIAQPDEFLQGPRSVGRDYAREVPGSHDRRAADRR